MHARHECVQVVRKGRLMPGHIFLVDFNSHRVIEDTELKAQYASSHPYPEWLANNAFSLDDVVKGMSTKLQEVRCCAVLCCRCCALRRIYIGCGE